LSTSFQPISTLKPDEPFFEPARYEPIKLQVEMFPEPIWVWLKPVFLAWFRFGGNNQQFRN
jgi:hypothetical protein